MKSTSLLAIMLLGVYSRVSAQTFELTSLYLTANSLPKAYSGKLEIGDSTVVFTTNGLVGDTSEPVTTIEKIIRKKGAYVKSVATSGVNNYDWALSDDKSEKKDNVYVISVLWVSKDGLNRKTYYFKGRLMP